MYAYLPLCITDVCVCMWVRGDRCVCVLVCERVSGRERDREAGVGGRTLLINLTPS